MQSLEDELILCHSLYVKAIQADHLSAVVVLEKQLDHLLDVIAKRKRRT